MHDEALIALPDLLSNLGVERPVLIGHSDGASIALIPWACAAPEWAARPVTSNSIKAAPLRRETRLPLGRPGSEANLALAAVDGPPT